MASADSVPEDSTIPDATPERWETAVEDIAQLVALGLDRAQDLADVIAELNRTRPGVVKAVSAGIGGALVGAVIAGRIPRRRPSAKRRATEAAKAVQKAAQDRVSVLEQAAAVAQAAAQRMAERAPSASDIRSRLPRVDRSALGDRASKAGRRASEARETARRRFAGQGIGLGQVVTNGAKLVPIVLALLRNPLVRQLLWSSATRMAARRR